MARTLRTVIAGLLLAGSLAIEAGPAVAAPCTPAPPRSSRDGRLRIRTYGIVVFGTVGAVPSEPHGAYSLTLNVTRYYAGRGPNTIVITNYGNAHDLHDRFWEPRNRTSLRASVEFARRFGGQRAIFFITPNDTALGRDTQGRYREQYATHQCLYNVVGQKDVSVFRPLLDRIFAQPPPTPGQTALPEINPSGIPTGTGERRASAPADDSRSDEIVRAGALAVIVAASLLLYRNPRSPLFERWRGPSKGA